MGATRRTAPLSPDAVAVTARVATSPRPADDGESPGAHPGRDLVCASCGYGICVSRARLPACPMCGGSAWQPAAARIGNLDRELGVDAWDGWVDIAPKDDQPQVHAHVALGKSDGSAWGGHLLEAHVWPTLEPVLVESPVELRRTFDDETGLALITIEPETAGEE